MKERSRSLANHSSRRTVYSVGFLAHFKVLSVPVRFAFENVVIENEQFFCRKALDDITFYGVVARRDFHFVRAAFQLVQILFFYGKSTVFKGIRIALQNHAVNKRSGIFNAAVDRENNVVADKLFNSVCVGEIYSVVYNRNFERNGFGIGFQFEFVFARGKTRKIRIRQNEFRSPPRIKSFVDFFAV